jgi:putative membrane protein
MEPSGRDAARIYLIGIFMGSADAVPGVSGGTIALIAGVYERLIDAITALTSANVIRFLQSIRPPVDRDDLVGVLEDVDVTFLLPLGLGIVTAVVLVTRAVHYADQHHPVALFGFFFGLIAASAVVLWRQVVVTERRHIVAAVAGFVIAFVLSADGAVFAGHNPGLTFLAGVVAVSAMILPGISGSLMLVILGQYTYMTGVLSEFTNRLAALASGGGIDRLLTPGTTVVTFVAGAVVGLLTISRLVRRALDRDRETTLAFLVSLVIGALRAPVAEIGGREGLSWTPATIGEFLLVAAVGALILYALDRYAVDVEVDVDPNDGQEVELDSEADD